MEEEVEIWKPVPGYEGLYDCSNFGRVKSLQRKGKLNDTILGKRYASTGYLSVNLCKEGVCSPKTIHRLVAILFIPNPLNKPDVGHIDENPKNPHYKNLEWCTEKENIQYHHRNGLDTYSQAKLNREQVLAIFNSKEHWRVLSERYGTGKRNIMHIRSGQTWKHVTGGNLEPKK